MVEGSAVVVGFTEGSLDGTGLAVGGCDGFPLGKKDWLGTRDGEFVGLELTLGSKLGSSEG